MRVLHVTDCYLPRRGGIELHVHDLATNQRKQDIDARVATPRTHNECAGEDDWVHRVSVSGPASFPGTRGIRELTHLFETLRPDVVHAHLSVISPFAATAARLAATSGIPTVVTVHSMWHHRSLSTAFCAAFGLSGLPIAWTAVSAAATTLVERVVGSDTTVTVLPNAVDLSAWAPTSSAGPADSPVRIVTVMRLARRKRPLPFARMLRDMRAHVPADIELRATIIGDGPKRRELEQYLARHRMDSWVEVTGQLDRSEIRDELARSTFYVAPARLESFGIAALEARTAGLPVVADCRSGVTEFVTDGFDGALVRGDVDMTGAMIRLASNAEHRDDLTFAARNTNPSFGWDANVDRSMSTYALAAHLVETSHIVQAPAARQLPSLTKATAS